MCVYRAWGYSGTRLAWTDLTLQMDPHECCFPPSRKRRKDTCFGLRYQSTATRTKKPIVERNISFYTCLISSISTCVQRCTLGCIFKKKNPKNESFVGCRFVPLVAAYQNMKVSQREWMWWTTLGFQIKRFSNSNIDFLDWGHTSC